MDELGRNLHGIMRSNPLLKLLKPEIFIDHTKYRIRELMQYKNSEIDQIFKSLLEDIIANYSYYKHHDLETQFFHDLLEMIYKIDIEVEQELLNKLLEIMKILQNESRKFGEDHLEEILEVVYNNDINSLVRIKFFNVFIENLIIFQFESLLPIFLFRDRQFDSVKLEILDKVARYELFDENLQETYLKIYNEIENKEIRQRFEDILIRLGKICGNPDCKKIINQNKKKNEINFCNFCNKTYCENCQNKNYRISKCDFCGKLVCQQHYNHLDLENMELCELCLNDGTYANDQIICKNCQESILNCHNTACGKIVCREHQLTCFICEKNFCPDCAENLLSSENKFICIECKKNRVNCEVCKKEIYINGNAYQCDDCGKFVCEEHITYIPDWLKKRCPDCLEMWKDYVWTMQTEGH